MVKNNPVKATRCLYSILCFLNTQVCYFCYFKKNTYCILFSYTICLLLFLWRTRLVLSLNRTAEYRLFCLWNIWWWSQLMIRHLYRVNDWNFNDKYTIITTFIIKFRNRTIFNLSIPSNFLGEIITRVYFDVKYALNKRSPLSYALIISRFS